MFYRRMSVLKDFSEENSLLNAYKITQQAIYVFACYVRLHALLSSADILHFFFQNKVFEKKKTKQNKNNAIRVPTFCNLIMHARASFCRGCRLIRQGMFCPCYNIGHGRLCLCQKMCVFFCSHNYSKMGVGVMSLACFVLKPEYVGWQLRPRVRHQKQLCKILNCAT